MQWLAANGYQPPVCVVNKRQCKICTESCWEDGRNNTNGDSHKLVSIGADLPYKKAVATVNSTRETKQDLQKSAKFKLVEVI